MTRRGYPTQDGLRAAEITLTASRVGAEAVLGEPDQALPLIERVVDEAIAALCAEAVGAMAALHALTVDYLKTRQQFGVPIGTFQALQHRAVDMLIASSRRAAWPVRHPDGGRARRPRAAPAVSAAKVQIGRLGTFVGQQAIQLHGGIGMTDEYKVGHYFKRLTMIDMASATRTTICGSSPRPAARAEQPPVENCGGPFHDSYLTPAENSCR